MAEIFDFSKSLIRCSAIYYIMVEGKDRTPKQKYDNLCAILAEETQKYDDMGERLQGMKSGLSKAAKIAGLEQEIAKLEPKKHEDPLNAGSSSVTISILRANAILSASIRLAGVFNRQ